MNYPINLQSDVNKLNGVGIEYLTDKYGTVIAFFYNGQMGVIPSIEELNERYSDHAGAAEETLIAA